MNAKIWERFESGVIPDDKELQQVIEFSFQTRIGYAKPIGMAA